MLTLLINNNSKPNNSNSNRMDRVKNPKKSANSQQPTRRTRHVEMKHFVILQWTDDKFINFIDTKTDENSSDSLSKPPSWTKFYEHTGIFMGRQQPAYTDSITRPHSHSHKGIVHFLSLHLQNESNHLIITS